MKYFLGFLGVVILVVLVFVLVVRGFSGRSSTKPLQIQLSDYTNTSTTMRYIAQGPVLANQNYHEVRITVGRDANTIEIIEGYEGQVIKAKTYPNNSEAYGNFLRALQLLGYTKGADNTTLSDERGYCPSGNRYIYEIINGGGSEVQRYWRGTCGVGTFKGNSQSIRALFRKQIPDYGTFVGNLSIAS